MDGVHKFKGAIDFLSFQSSLIEYLVLPRHVAVLMENPSFETSETDYRETQRLVQE